MLIQLHDLQFYPYIGEDQIAKAINEVAVALNKNLGDKNPLFIGVLNGAFRFVSEVVGQFEGDCEVSFVKVNSYVGTASTEVVNTVIGLQEEVCGRTVVILEDIVDTGNTIHALMAVLEKQGCAIIQLATLFFKPKMYKKSIKIDYVGLEIPNVFVVGYGLDYNGLGRNLNEVYQLKTTKMTNLVLFGPPGAGKGTQAEVLKEKYNLVHISTGDVFRYHIKNATALGILAKSYIDKGQLVPDEVTINMLHAQVDKTPDAQGFIFDGFPRTEAQAEALQLLLASKNTAISAMLALEVDDEILVTRLLHRGKSSGRVDDADEHIIRNRIKVYYEETAILKNYYEKQNKYYGIDGVGEVTAITNRLSTTIDSL